MRCCMLIWRNTHLSGDCVTQHRPVDKLNLQRKDHIYSNQKVVQRCFLAYIQWIVIHIHAYQTCVCLFFIFCSHLEQFSQHTPAYSVHVHLVTTYSCSFVAMPIRCATLRPEVYIQYLFIEKFPLFSALSLFSSPRAK